MSGTTQTGKSNYEPRTERVQIKSNHIPDALLESVLTNLISKANDRYRKIQGDIDIKHFQIPIEPQPKLKRTIKEINECNNVSKEYEARVRYCNEKMKEYDIVSPLKAIEKATTTNVPMSDILQLSVFEIMQESISNKFANSKEHLQINKNTLSMMSEWSEIFIQSLTQRLKRLMEIQRRRQPSRNDLMLLEREGLFDKSGIHDMYELCNLWNKSIENKEKYKLIVNKANIASTAYNGNDEGVFNVLNHAVQAEEQWWIDQIIHRKKRKTYIPEWMPPLPPDYTFKSTPKYNETVTNPVILRQKIVDEGRLGERALDHTIVRKDHQFTPFFGNSTSIEKEENANVSKSDLKEFEDVENRNPIIDAIVQNNEDVNDQKIDLVKLAKKRMAILDKKRKKEEVRVALRVESDESKLGKIFGFYTSAKKLPENSRIELNEYRSNTLNNLICNLQKQEQLHAEWLIQQEGIRKRIDDEKSKYAEANEIQLGGIEESNNNESFMFSNVDEDVDFDVEFSDIEDIQAGRNEEVTETREVQVRFEEGTKLVQPIDSHQHHI